MDIAWLFLSDKRKKLIYGGNNSLTMADARDHAVVMVVLNGIKSSKVIINGSIVFFCLSNAHVNAEMFEFISTDVGVVSISSLKLSQNPQKSPPQWNGNGVEFLTPVSIHTKPVAEPSTQTKRNNSPQKNDEGRVSVEKQSELTPEGSHKFWQLLLSMIATSLFLLPLGAYFGMRGTLRHDWAKHKSKRRVPKALPLAMILILSIPRRIKPRCWQIWEQRHWFRDMKECHGLERAYEDTQFWKWSINKTDYQ
ncbi:hypothetical protein [Yersinia massiliensis]|uniref:hypothetical protein n=1 Tax=Yersinia massiliensis TaxID=419257 RepID=UPI000305FE23|nr:hypothetical protein [Yersinia massiliensis]